MRNGYYKESLQSYRTWQSMRARCKKHTRYLKRGITVCARWGVYENFVLDMGEPEQGLELDRIDNNGNYCKENCRWVTHKENVRNSTKTKLSQEKANEIRKLRAEGLSGPKIAKLYKVSYQTVYDIVSFKYWP